MLTEYLTIQVVCRECFKGRVEEILNRLEIFILHRATDGEQVNVGGKEMHYTYFSYKCHLNFGQLKTMREELEDRKDIRAMIYY